jgi:stage II sporulation protein D
MCFFLFADLKEIAYESYLKGDYKKAIEYYKSIYESGKDYKALLDIAALYKYMDDYNGAIEYLKKSLEFHKDSYVYSELGWLYFHKSELDKAEDYFKEAFSLDNSNYLSVLGLSMVYSQRKDLVKTIEYLNIYKSIRGDYAGVDYLFAWNYVNFEMYDKAKEYLIETLRKDPSFIEARIPLAQIYLKEDDYNNAYNQYYRILDYIPDHPLARKMVQAIEGRITKQPEDIRPPFKIIHPTIISESYDINFLNGSIKLKVAIGTDEMGNHRKNREIKIRSFDNIRIYGSGSEKLYRELNSGERLFVRYQNNGVGVWDSSGKLLNFFTKPFVLRPKDQRNGTIIIEADTKNKNPYFRYSDREYRGEIIIVPYGGYFGIINNVELELYLLGVVPREMEPKWPIEALKAQTVIARTEAVRRFKEGPHKKSGYHLCDSQHCQVYGGVVSESNSTTKSVFETEGEVLTYNGKLAYAFYHANCGGFIQAASEVKGWGNVLYLIAHPDSDEKNEGLSPWEFNIWIKTNPQSFCNYPGMVPDSHFRWMRIIKRSDISFILNKRYGIGDLKSIVILRRSRSGNVNSIKVVGTKKTVIIEKEHVIRNSFGLNSLKSTLFNIEINRFNDGRIRNIWFYGGGWGHSIGMCQSGAVGLALKRNKDYKEILNFYFPQTKIKKLKYIK